MVEPGSFSCGSQRYQLHGNGVIICEIEQMAKKAIRSHVGLYDTQENIKQYLCEKYGVAWYDKSAEAVQYIIEDAYASAERGKRFQGMLW